VTRLRSFHEWAPGRLLLWEKTGLTIWDWGKDAKTPFPYLPADTAAWNSGVYSFCEDRQGRLWMGTLAGVFVFDPADRSFRRYHRDSGDRLALSHNVIRDITQDHTGAIWIATWDGGVNLLDEKAGETRHFFNSTAEKAAYQNGARRVFVSRDGTLWAGTRGGLHRYDRAENQFKRYNHDPYDAESIGENTAFDIYEDEEGYLWIGTYGGGLNRFDPQTEKFRRYTIRDGLPDNNVFSIFPDGKGHLWLSTYVGIVKFDPKQEAFHTLDYRDGLLNKQYDAFSHYRSPHSGLLIYEGKQGIDIFHPDRIRTDSTLPVVRFTGFSLFNQPVPIRRGGKQDKAAGFQLEQAISETKALSLSYRASRVMTFEFAGLHFANPEKNRYAYFLKGFDQQRQYIQGRRSATFTNLPPGRYTLWVYASNANGIWGETGASIALHIRPPWWLAWWAFVLYALAAAGIFYAFFHYQRRRWHLRAELAEQQREAQRLKELDVFKSQLYDNFTHEFRTPLTIILALAEEIPRHHQKEETGLLFRAVEMIRRNGHRLLQIVNQILDLSKLDAGMLPVHLAQGDVIALLRYLAESHESLADSKGISLSFEAGLASLIMDYDEEKLGHIFSNLLSNAVKFTDEGGRVALRVAAEQDAGQPKLLIEVHDTGIGIPPEQLPHIFERFYQVDPGSGRHGLRREGGTGIGLALAKELTELLGGSIAAESTVGAGSCFRVRLPIANEAPLKQMGERLVPAHTPAVAIRTIAAPLPAKGLPSLLIVEDSPDIITYLRSCLEDQYDIITAPNGRLGTAKAIEAVPDIIISDVMMPEMDGFELSETLKNDPRTSHIPIILLTARASAADRIAGLKRGADAYLPKPFSKEELMVRLEKLIELRAKLRERYAGLVPAGGGDEPALQMEDQFLAQARQAVLGRLGDASFSVPDFCRSLGVSRTQLHNKLTALTGRSATAFIRLLRLQHARTLLHDTQLNIAEIAYTVGFNDPSYFTQCFHQEFGKSPSEERGS
jgi:signal transduction histidine kinase/AraC-like DNA-binding protein/streptogramin lyase/ActR/RegA family two-component response regulator